jgi:hypothetical protein
MPPRMGRLGFGKVAAPAAAAAISWRILQPKCWDFTKRNRGGPIGTSGHLLPRLDRRPVVRAPGKRPAGRLPSVQATRSWPSSRRRRIASISWALANARTLARSGRALSVPDGRVSCACYPTQARGPAGIPLALSRRQMLCQRQATSQAQEPFRGLTVSQHRAVCQRQATQV